MPTYTYPVSAQTVIRLQSCEDDVTISGGETTTIELSTSADAEIDTTITQTEDGLAIERIEERLTLRVPRGAQIEIEQQAGDVMIQDVASVRLVDIGGDVKLRAIGGSVLLDSIGGDLVIDRAETISGQFIGSDARFVAAAALRVEEIAGDLRVTDIPTVQIEQIGGDAYISGVEEQCQLGTIEGDLKIRSASSVSVRSVAGDLSIEQVGALEAEAIEGDCTISGEHGAATISTIQGDLNARLRQGPLRVTSVGGDVKIDGAAVGFELDDVGGDLDLRLSLADGALYRAHVGGDAAVSLPASCNLTLNAQVQGAISGVSASRGRRQSGEISMVVGTGAAQLTLAVDGDLSLRGPGLRVQSPPPATARALPAATGATVRLQPERGHGAQASGSSDEERLALLRMLADGRLSVDEAEQLLNAIDQRSAQRRQAVSQPAAADVEALED